MNKKEPSFKKAEPPAIKRIAVAGYKSVSREQSIEIRPLTILAGANSSGKSSIMQPLLLLKQTLEASYNPGALLLDGPNIKFSLAEQLFSRDVKGKRGNTFSVGLEDDISRSITIYFNKPTKGSLAVARMDYDGEGYGGSLRAGMDANQRDKVVVSALSTFSIDNSLIQEIKSKFVIQPNRCFLEVAPGLDSSQTGTEISGTLTREIWNSFSNIRLSPLSPGKYFAPYITGLIHLPGLRGNPERNYPVTGIGLSFPGTFESYTASVIAHWQTQSDTEKLKGLGSDLENLGLTWKVVANPVSDTRVELQVGRLPKQSASEADDLVNIADVGLGVSQTLPVLVALHAAERGQLVYLEQPEIHLHPRAQTAMAQVLADAAKRGVRVVAETHSSLLLLGIQTLVAEGELPPELVKLHWFTRGEDGMTNVRSADLDEAGAYGDWPEDFDEVALTTESRYIDAAAQRQQVH
jgi:putative AbiEii toxin of type IV toxin-antitoxin system/AAA ATPase-like protein